MESRRRVGGIVLAVAAAVLLLGFLLEGTGADDAGDAFIGLGFFVYNPLVLGILLYLMFRRGGGQQQQQQVVIYTGAGGTAAAPAVQVRCPSCAQLSPGSAAFCASCGKPISADVQVRARPAGAPAAPAKSAGASAPAKAAKPARKPARKA